MYEWGGLGQKLVCEVFHSRVVFVLSSKVMHMLLRKEGEPGYNAKLIRPPESSQQYKISAPRLSLKGVLCIATQSA